MGNPLKNLFLNPQGHLRNGWWLLVFIGLFLASRALYGPVKQALQQSGVSGLGLAPLHFLFVLGVTWACTRLRRESLASIGFQLDRLWLRQAIAGMALGTASMLLIALLIWSAGGIAFELDPGRSVSALVSALYVFVFVALFEETLFRGFLFQRLVAGAGPWVAQIVLAVVFALAHWGNPGMEGATRAWATADIALGAILLGLAYLRTRSLALPVGLHLGWNWAQGALLGFGVSGVEQAGWLRPLYQDRPEWLTGGSFGPEASMFAVVVDLLVIALLWQWQGSAIAAAPALRSDAGGSDIGTDNLQPCEPPSI